jgi:hypothetical protein
MGSWSQGEHRAKKDRELAGRLTLQITVSKLAPPRGRPDAATWAPWAERLVPLPVEVTDSSGTPLRSEENITDQGSWARLLDIT